jgi:hypothetical protein
MKRKIRIIKRGSQKPKEPEPEQSSRQSTRDITSTIKLWVSEFKERHRADEQHSRNIHKLTLRTLSQINRAVTTRPVSCGLTQRQRTSEAALSGTWGVPE